LRKVTALSLKGLKPRFERRRIDTIRNGIDCCFDLLFDFCEL
jgi:hypothetical protein